MKVTVIKLKTAMLIVLAVWCANSFAQTQTNTTMYVMRNDSVVFQSVFSDIDSVTFDKATPDDALILQKNDGSPDDKILLNDIQQLSFSEDSLFIEEMLNGNKVYYTYALDNIAKLLFGNNNITGINNLSAKNRFDVLVSVTPAGDLTVESSVAIKSLTVFGADGKTISKQNYNGVKTLHVTSLRNTLAAVYLVRIETNQGTVIKKVVKPSNK